MQQAAYEEQVLLASQQVVDGRELPSDPDQRADGAGLAVQVVPKDAGGASIRRYQGRQDSHHGGLARSVRTEQSEDLALPDAEVDVVEDDLFSVCLAQAGDGNRGTRRVLDRSVHASHTATLTLGQCQALGGLQ